MACFKAHEKLDGSTGLVEFFFTVILRLIARNIGDKLFDSGGTLFQRLGTTLFFSFLFFYQGFLPTLTIHRTAGEGRGPSFIPLYHFHPLTNIETFICNFACEMTMTYF